ncbi:spore coat protein [Paraliobacillus salinarum]|uniref:spore coat protein n=1 Tax=Paraliobacillus salinarum TaxID=1158996 RepID=UPI0015F3F032|nr:spore coat protein [Paraliobacillus salinarum]
MQQQMNNSQMNQSNHILQQPPTMVSSKDLLYLTDMMSWNLNATKKAHFFANQCNIPEIKTVLEQVCQMHQKHYQKILQHTTGQQNGMLQ